MKTILFFFVIYQYTQLLCILEWRDGEVLVINQDMRFYEMKRLMNCWNLILLVCVNKMENTPIHKFDTNIDTSFE